jgi:hypothetical protein
MSVSLGQARVAALDEQRAVGESIYKPRYAILDKERMTISAVFSAANATEAKERLNNWNSFWTKNDQLYVKVGD